MGNERIIWLTMLLWCSSFALIAKDDPRIEFIENKNQWRASVLFRASTPQADVFLLPDRIQFLVRREEIRTSKGGKLSQGSIPEGGHHGRGSNITSQMYEVTFQGANKNPRVESESPSVTSYNYFIGNDRSHWGSKAHGYGAVYYRDVYDGIDLKIYSDNMRVKQDWNVSPGGDPEKIKLHYEGPESMHLKDGNLVIETKAGEVTELMPFAYQDINGVRKTVVCHYHLRHENLSYEFPEGYDVSNSLIIDPILVFSGYSGSTFDNWGNSATYDAHGNLYSGGMVTTTYFGFDFPTTPGAYKTDYIGGEWDIGILKYDSLGASLLYATYVGGNGTESPQSLVVNQNGELLILGATSSTDFPVTNGTTFKGGDDVDPIYGTDYYGGSDIYVARISEDGSAFLSGTYVGGSRNDGLNIVSGSMASNDNVQSPLARNYGDQVRGDIVTDAQNNVYFASSTLSADFPSVNSDATNQYNGGTHDAVIVKLAPDLSSIIWSRFVGGSGTDAAYSLKLSGTEVYAAGGTTSADFKGMTGLHSTLQGGVDGWIAHISSDGSQIIHATYMGTTAYDQTYFIDLSPPTDPELSVFAYGQTQGNYPVEGQVYSNLHGGQFVHRLKGDLSASYWSTVIGSGGSSPNISPTAFLVSDCNTIYLSGWGGVINTRYEWNGYEYITRDYVGGDTNNMPITANAYQHTTNGNDFYFMVLSVDAKQFLYGTYLGGSGSYTHVDGGTSRFDKSGIVYHSVCAGCGGVSDFPAVNVPPARQTNNSRNCNNAAFKFDLSLLKANIQTNSVRLNVPGLNKICLSDSIVFQNKSIGGQIFKWNFGDGGTLTKTDTARIVYRYKKSGVYRVSLTAIDAGTCRGIDSTFTQVTVFQINAAASGTQSICTGGQATLTASGGVAYSWVSSDGLFTSQNAQVFVTPTDTLKYYVKITDSNNCSVKDTVKVSVVPGIDLQLSTVKKYDCQVRPLIEVSNLTKGDDATFIDFGDGTTSQEKNEVHNFQKDGTYIVRVVGQKEFCTYDKKLSVPVYTLDVPNVITPEDSKSLNDTFVIMYGTQKIEDAGIKVSLLIYNRWGKEVFKSDDYHSEWAGENLAAGVYYYEAIINGETTCKSWIQLIK